MEQMAIPAATIMPTRRQRVAQYIRTRSSAQKAALAAFSVAMVLGLVYLILYLTDNLPAALKPAGAAGSAQSGAALGPGKIKVTVMDPVELPEEPATVGDENSVAPPDDDAA